MLAYFGWNGNGKLAVRIESAFPVRDPNFVFRFLI